MNQQARIFVAGHRGMVGSALMRKLTAAGYPNVITRSHAELDLTDQAAVQRFFETERIDVVLLAAARVGGILANATRPAEFIYQNLVIEANVIHAAYRAQVERLVFLRLVVHLPEAMSAADPRGVSADLAAGADQRRVRDRQDCRRQAVRRLQPPVQHAVRRVDADQSVRPERQLRPGQ